MVIYEISDTMYKMRCSKEGGDRMPIALVWLIAIVSTGLCLFLWFLEVRRSLRRLLSTVESAESQLASCRRKAKSVEQTPEVLEMLQRSEQIYQQAVEGYHMRLKTTTL